MSSYLANRSGGDTDTIRFRQGEGPLEPVAVRYLTTVLNQAQQSMTLRNSRELRTLAEALDRLIGGKTAEAGDLLIQRFKAVEMASGEGSWRVAQHLELIPSSAVTAVNHEEREAACRQEVREARVRRAISGDPGPARSPSFGRGGGDGAANRRPPMQFSPGNQQRGQAQRPG